MTVQIRREAMPGERARLDDIQSPRAKPRVPEPKIGKNPQNIDHERDPGVVVLSEVRLASNTNAWRFCVAPMLDWTDRHCRFFLRQISRHARLYTEKIGRASCRERCVSTCRSRWSPYH